MNKNNIIDSIYIVSREEGAGSMVLSIGLIATIVEHYHNVAIFKPLVDNSQYDSDIETILKYYNLSQEPQSAIGITLNEAEDMLANKEEEFLIEKLLEKYRKLNQEYDFVVCIGSAVAKLNKMIGYDINVELAKNFSAGVAGVFPVHLYNQYEVAEALKLWSISIQKQGAEIFLICANRCSEELCDELHSNDSLKEEFNHPVCCLPEIEELDRLSIGTLAKKLSLEWLAGEDHHKDHTIHSMRLVSGHLQKLLSSVSPYELIVTSSERLDIVSAMILSAESIATPMSSGVLLCGDRVEKNFIKILEGRDELSLPLLYSDKDEIETMQLLLQTEPTIHYEDKRKISTILGTFSQYINREKLLERLDTMPKDILTPAMFRMQLFERARINKQTIILPESEDDRILKATDILLRRKVVDIILVGESDDIMRRSKLMGLNLSDAVIIDPKKSELTQKFATSYYNIRKHKGINKDMALDRVMMNKTLFGTMAVELGVADGMVSGAIHSTRDTILPALQVIKIKDEFSIASSCFFMGLDTKTLVYADCAINPDPTAKELAEIAIQTTQSAKEFGIPPRVAMLSYSTGESGVGEDVQKVKEATEIVQQKYPNLPIAGPIQYDAAIDPNVAKIKMPNNPVAGSATVFIFPDLDTGNIAYKAVQRSANATAIGPVMQGLKKPVNDLSRGCTIDDIIDTVAITAVQAQGEKE